MTAFSDKLAHLVNVERMAAVEANDSARIVDMLGRLTHCIGWTIAIQIDDDTTRAYLAEGVCARIYYGATGGAAIIQTAKETR